MTTMPNPVAAVVEVARQTLRLLLQYRMLWLLLLAECGVAGIGLAIGFDNDHMTGRQAFSTLAWWLLAFVLVPWSTLFFGVQAVHGDIEDRTFQYLFVRPVPRPVILIGKWLAIALLMSAVHVGGVTLLYFAVASHGALGGEAVDVTAWLVFAEAMLLLSAAYAAVACCFSAMFRWPMVWGAGFIVGAQMLVANLPIRASIRYATITDPVRRFVLDGLDPDRELARMLWPAERDWRAELIGAPLQNLGILVAIALLLALVSHTRSEYDSRTRE